MPLTFKKSVFMPLTACGTASNINTPYFNWKSGISCFCRALKGRISGLFSPWAQSSKQIILSMTLYFDWCRSFCSRLMQELQTQSQSAKSKITAFRAPHWVLNIILHTLALLSIFIFLLLEMDGDALTSTICVENPAWDICKPKAVPFWLVPAENWVLLCKIHCDDANVLCVCVCGWQAVNIVFMLQLMGYTEALFTLGIKMRFGLLIHV